jgi:hypothetical protein
MILNPFCFFKISKPFTSAQSVFASYKVHFNVLFVTFMHVISISALNVKFQIQNIKELQSKHTRYTSRKNKGTRQLKPQNNHHKYSDKKELSNDTDSREIKRRKIFTATISGEKYFSPPPQPSNTHIRR